MWPQRKILELEQMRSLSSESPGESVLRNLAQDEIILEGQDLAAKLFGWKRVDDQGFVLFCF